MCWEIRHTDILILLHAGSTLPYGSKEGCRDAPPPPAEKNAFSPKDFPFLQHPSETSGDGRTLVALPCVIRCSIFNNYYASALTSLQREWALLRHLLAGFSRGVGGGIAWVGAAELQLHDSAQGLHPPSVWQPGGRLEEFHLFIQLSWNNSVKGLVRLSQ